MKAEVFGPYGTVARLGLGLSYGVTSTLDQPVNTELISQPGYVLHPAFDFSMFQTWLLTVESQLRFVPHQAPSAATLVQDPGTTSNFMAGFHFNKRAFELGMVAGLNESAYVALSPSTTSLTMQNLMLPFYGARLTYNGRWTQGFFLRVEAMYLVDLPGTSSRSVLSVTSGDRLLIHAEMGIGSWKDWLRFTAEFGVHNTNTNLGRQKNMLLNFGISIGNIWGSKTPLVY